MIDDLSRVNQIKEKVFALTGISATTTPAAARATTQQRQEYYTYIGKIVLAAISALATALAVFIILRNRAKKRAATAATAAATAATAATAKKKKKKKKKHNEGDDDAGSVGNADNAGPPSASSPNKIMAIIGSVIVFIGFAGVVFWASSIELWEKLLANLRIISGNLLS